MQDANLQLSDREIQLFANRDVILTKNRILQQTGRLLQHVQGTAQERAATFWPGSSVFSVPPKISRGETYRGLPYMVLDYPRNFGRNDVMAVRSFFWWGNFFSSTLHLSGHYARAYAEKIAAGQALLGQYGYYLQTGTDPWTHDFEEGGYKAVASFAPAAFGSLLQQPLIKIAAKWPLEEWPFAAKNLLASWECLLRTCLD